MSNPAAIRHEIDKRAAVRAALARPLLRLDPMQLKLVLSAHDASCAKVTALTAETGKTTARTDGATDDRAYAVAGRRIDEIIRQMESLSGRRKEIEAHPQVRAAILAREAKEERRQ